MPYETPRPIPITAPRPLFPAVAPMPLAFFAAALVVDVTYWQTAEMQWANFSVWLIVAGLIASGLAILAGLFDFLTDRRASHMAAGWLPVLGEVVAVALAVVDAFVHSRDAYTSVVPTGLGLSVLVVVILLATQGLRGASAPRPVIGIIS